MGNAKAGAWALILGALSYIALMLAHPTHMGGPAIGPFSLSAIVHAAALATQPLLLFGFWALTRAMDERPLAQLALCFYALAAALVMLAATLSGLVIPAIIAAGHDGAHGVDPETLRQTLQGQANYTVILNRSVAAVHVVLFAVAMVLWAIAWPGRAVLTLLARVLGLIAGLGVIAWALSGTMTLEAQHGALLVTFVQMLWTLLAAAALMRTKT
jgi:hypothetical protein